MKAIKKVEVTPLDYNIGKIIDSASSTDDKTKNTYSMRIIDQKLDTKANSSNTYTKSETDSLLNALDSEKVDKAGDTLTGALNFQNTDTYTAIEKTRTLYDQEQEPFDVKVTVGVGANSSSVIENWLDDDLMTRLELRPNGEIWNATSNSKIVERGDFAIITGTLSNGSATVNYPTGFTKENCVVISTMIQHPSNTNYFWGNGATFDSVGAISGRIPNGVRLGSSDIRIDAKIIGLSNGDPANVTELTTPYAYKIVLYKYI